jgi:putative NADPH-quinone reductase
MSKRILIIDGHPDPAAHRFNHAIVSAYRQEAIGAGHEARSTALTDLSFPLLHTKAEFDAVATCATVTSLQADILWCDHIVIVYPLWLGSMPALLKGLFEQIFRPSFAFAQTGSGDRPKGILRGKSARIIVTMGMPALIYRWYFGAHSLKCLQRNILAFCGISPIRSSVIGSVGAASTEHHERWIARIRQLARNAR